MNVLTVTGRLTVDPARRDTSKGVVCEFRVAVDGQRRLWLPVTCWGHLAGRCAQHLRRGRHVAVSGPLLVDEYLTHNGDRQRRWYLKGEHVTYLDPPPVDPNVTEVAPDPAPVDDPLDDPAHRAGGDTGEQT